MTRGSDSPSDAPEKSHGGTWALAIVGLALLYLLSAGPVDALTKKFRVADEHLEWLRVVYYPVVWLSENPTTGGAVMAYLDWWEKMLE